MKEIAISKKCQRRISDPRLTDSSLNLSVLERAKIIIENPSKDCCNEATHYTVQEAESEFEDFEVLEHYLCSEHAAQELASDWPSKVYKL